MSWGRVADLMTLHARVRRAGEELVAAGIPTAEARLDAELLARHVLGWDRAMFVARAMDQPPVQFEAGYRSLIERRVRREPVAYIIGRQEFWGRSFEVGPGVLIPRPETEILIEEALEWARTRRPTDALRVVDVGTGSGCLGITLALELPHTTVEATDISGEALAIARQNASRLEAAVRFHLGSVLADIAPPVDLIVANPPYITKTDYAELQPEVQSHEPHTALVGGHDGLETMRLVVKAAPDALAPEGRLLMEIGYDQSAAVKQMVDDTAGLVLLRIRPDLQGIPRVVVAARRPSA